MQEFLCSIVSTSKNRGTICKCIRGGIDTERTVKFSGALFSEEGNLHQSKRMNLTRTVLGDKSSCGVCAVWYHREV